MKGINLTVTPSIRDALNEIRQRDGNVTDKAVVEHSKAKTSPFHKMMLWDKPDAAAYIGRLEIARQLIMSVKILPFEAKALNVSVALRKYHGRVGGGYADVLDVVSQKTLRERLLAAALRDLEAIQEKYQVLSELEPIFAEIRKLRKARKNN